MSEQTGDTPDSLRPAGGVEADDPPGSGEGAGIRPREAPAGRGGGRFGGALQRATMWMAAGTALSRLSGLLRVLVLAYALGATHLATSYNLANTTPNMLYDIVLGGVLSATFIPVFVDRLATRSDRDAWRAISAVISLAAVVLVVMTVVFWVAAPGVIAGFTALDHTRTVVQQHGLGRERTVAVSLLRWFVPQVALYGFIALLTALLNTRRRFVAPMWVPIANNVVCIAVLLWFRRLTDAPSLAGAEAHPGWVVLLGLGTTLGVALQAVLLVMTARGAGLSRLHWRWNPRHEAVRTVVRLGGWTFGFVLANQITLFFVLALAVGASGPDPVSSYTYAYIFMQVPYAVVAVSVMSAVTPGLAEQWTTGDLTAFRRRLSGGLRAVLVVILPATMGMFLLAKPAVGLLFAHGTYTVADADGTGSALALFSLGLPGFCTFLYVVRVLQSMQRTRVAFWLYLVENGTNIVLALALVHVLGVRGLALSLSVAYTVGAACGLVVLRRWLGPLGDRVTWAPLRRGALATVAMGAVVLVVSNLSGAQQGFALLLRVVGSVAVGGVVFLAASTVLGRRAEARGGRRPRASDPTYRGERRRVGGTGPAPGTATSGTPGPPAEDGLGFGGGLDYGGGLGPGTGMVPSVPPRGAVRLVGSSSGLGPVRPVGPHDGVRPATRPRRLGQGRHGGRGGRGRPLGGSRPYDAAVDGDAPGQPPQPGGPD